MKAAQAWLIEKDWLDLDKMWQDLTNFDRIWQKLTGFEKIWQVLTGLDGIQGNFAKTGEQTTTTTQKKWCVEGWPCRHSL